MGKYTFIYNTGKLRVFCDMETKELFYRRNTDAKAPVIVGGSHGLQQRRRRSGPDAI